MGSRPMASPAKRAPPLSARPWHHAGPRAAPRFVLAHLCPRCALDATPCPKLSQLHPRRAPACSLCALLGTRGRCSGFTTLQHGGSSPSGTSSDTSCRTHSAKRCAPTCASSASASHGAAILGARSARPGRLSSRSVTQLLRTQAEISLAQAQATLAAGALVVAFVVRGRHAGSWSQLLGHPSSCGRQISTRGWALGSS